MFILTLLVADMVMSLQSLKSLLVEHSQPAVPTALQLRSERRPAVCRPFPLKGVLCLTSWQTPPARSSHSPHPHQRSGQPLYHRNQSLWLHSATCPRHNPTAQPESTNQYQGPPPTTKVLGTVRRQAVPCCHIACKMLDIHQHQAPSLLHPSKTLDTHHQVPFLLHPAKTFGIYHHQASQSHLRARRSRASDNLRVLQHTLIPTAASL